MENRIKEQEHHEKKFTGWWIPKEVVATFVKGEINATELLLLSTIDSLCDGAAGCFASNKWLGENVHVKPSRVMQMLRHLHSLGLIRKKTRNGKRYLRTTWKRTKKLA